MKKVLLPFLCFLVFCGCSYERTQETRQDAYDRGLESGYEEGYDDGYAAGYKIGYDEGYDRGYCDCEDDHGPVVSRSIPTSDDFTVYISASGTMHKKSNCSGMTNYTEMPYSVASQYYDKKCSKCFK